MVEVLASPMEERGRDPLPRAVHNAGLAACAMLTLFLVATIATGRFSNWVQYEVVLSLVLVAVYALYPGPLARRWLIADLIMSAMLAAVGVACAAYMIVNHHEIAAYREGLPSAQDLIVYVSGTLVVLEAVRRTEGWLLLSVVLAAIAFLFVGPWLPGLLAHRGMDAGQVAELAYSQQGMFGIALGSIVDIVYIYVIFGVALRVSGAGEFFDWFASVVTLGRRSGSAQCAIVASALFGSINGSAPANVVANGAITINMMHRAGFSRVYAAAVEASSSVVGQIMPPVMGVGAFIMSEITGIPYVQIMLAALVPAFLFIFSLSIITALEAGRLGLKPLDEPSEGWTVHRLAQLFAVGLSFTVLLYLLLSGYSVDLAGLAAIVTILLATLPFPTLRPNLRKLVTLAVDGGREGLSVAVSCAAIGIIIGAVSATGLGVKISQAIVMLGDAHVLLSLILAAVCAILLGMGLPTAASYLMVVFIAGPALIKLGLPTLTAHMFIFYYAVMSAITPPVALAVFAAAAIAQAPVLSIGLTSVRLCLVAFLFPFLWAFQPELLLQDLSMGMLPLIAVGVVTLMFAVILLAAAQVGYFKGRLSLVERLACGAAAALIYIPNWSITALGVALGVFVLARRFFLVRRLNMPEAA